MVEVPFTSVAHPLRRISTGLKPLSRAANFLIKWEAGGGCSGECRCRVDVPSTCFPCCDDVPLHPVVRSSSVWYGLRSSGVSDVEANFLCPEAILLEVEGTLSSFDMMMVSKVDAIGFSSRLGRELLWRGKCTWLSFGDQCEESHPKVRQARLYSTQCSTGFGSQLCFFCHAETSIDQAVRLVLPSLTWPHISQRKISSLPFTSSLNSWSTAFTTPTVPSMATA